MIMDSKDFETFPRDEVLVLRGVFHSDVTAELTRGRQACSKSLAGTGRRHSDNQPEVLETLPSPLVEIGLPPDLRYYFTMPIDIHPSDAEGAYRPLRKARTVLAGEL